MGFPFAEAEKRTTAEASDYPLTSHFLTGMRHGRFVVSGIPITMPPAELFADTNKAHITHVFAFRLTSTKPMHYALSFGCFDNEGLMLEDFAQLINAVNDYLVELQAADVDVPETIEARTPVEGAFILYAPNGDDYESELETIHLYPPNMSPEVYNTSLWQALWQGIKEGFADNTA